VGQAVLIRGWSDNGNQYHNHDCETSLGADMEDLSYLNTEYARNKMVESRQLEENREYDGVQRWQRDLDGVFKQLTWELEQVIKQMKKGDEI